MKVVLRDFSKECDAGFILDSYPKGIYYGVVGLKKLHKKKNWMQAFYQKALSQLDQATIQIACLEEDPTYIVGYSIVENSQLEWVFVRPTFRQQGISKLLTKGKYSSINKDNLTPLGKEAFKAQT